MLTITGFHAIEEKIKSLDKTQAEKATLLYDKAGPRAKKILAQAEGLKVECRQVSTAELNKAVSSLDEIARDHRGIVLQIQGEKESASNIIEADSLKSFLKTRTKSRAELAGNAEKAGNAGEKNSRSIIMILDGITDPHNTGAIIRSCDQFGADLVVIPNRRSATESEIIARSSSGAASWVPLMFVPNLTRTLEILKDEGYWIYGADAGGDDVTDFLSGKAKVSDKVAIVMGSEGTGMSRIVKENCDKIVSIPTCGKLDSLNVSVAAGILLYNFRNF
ncbi:MAG: 23S rRNA (guanosine(2251)-2'-O)-methyltransferase RlmB [Treponemataceae bacterium]|nr:23S rRNA (guanosine(2251)-2'-O)-methyltransferase RlmB [Treponemataceae bacterium]